MSAYMPGLYGLSSHVNEVSGTTAGGSGPDSAFESSSIPFPLEPSSSGSCGLGCGRGCGRGCGMGCCGRATGPGRYDGGAGRAAMPEPLPGLGRGRLVPPYAKKKKKNRESTRIRIR